MRLCDVCGDPCDRPWFTIQYHRGATDELLLPTAVACGRMCARALLKLLYEENQDRLEAMA